MRFTCLRFALLLILFCASLRSGAAAPDKSGVKPSSISLPSGPGSIEGLGESFEPQLNTGTFNYRIPLKLPPVRGGAPELALEYNSGHGNGPLGLGWRLQLSHLQRQTDKGLPLYTEEDTYLDWSGEELVRQADGSFRQENEFAFARYERTPEGGWLASLRHGGKLWLGQSAISRLEWPGHGAFQWFVEASQDPNGNRVEYRWRHDRQQIYPEEIRYGLHATESSQFFRVVFAYETNRADVIVDFRPRFRCETRLRLTGVTVFLGERRIRHWRLGYDTNSPVSLLNSVTVFGDERSRMDSAAKANEDFLPPTVFDYARNVVGQNWKLQTNQLGFTVDFTTGKAELADVNSDGLPDILLDDDSEGYMTALNRGATRSWAPLQPVINSPAGASTRLRAETSRLVDLRGDGRTKLLLQDDLGFYFRGFAAPTRLSEPVDFPQAGHFPLNDPNVQFADLDFDKASDLVAADGNTLSIALARGNNVIEVPTPGGRSIRFSDGWQLADMNGDRMVDLVLPGLGDEGGTQVCLSRGFGAFEPSYAMLGGPNKGDLGVRGLAAVSLSDVNQDGLADLVYVDSGYVHVWLQEPGGRWGELVVVHDDSIPDFDANTTAIRFADMNGNGSTDIVWFEAGSSSVRWLELNSDDKPWLLNRVTTTLGRSVEVNYRSSTHYLLAAMGTDEEWTSFAPFPVPVVSQIVEGDGLGSRYTNQFTYRNAYYDGREREFRGFEQAVRRELGDDSQGAPMLVTRFRFDTGAQVEALKGKPLLVEAMDEAGSLFHRETNIWTARVLPTARAAGETRNNVFSYQREKTTEVRERLAAGQAVWLKEEFEFDDFGNQTRHTDWGRLDEGEPSWDDERVTVRTFSAAYPSGTANWLLDRLITEELQDEAGSIVTRKHFYYDDETFTSEQLGAVTKGNLASVREWITPGSTNAVEAARTRLAVRQHYDLFGNIIGSLDPLGVPSRPELGHQRRVEFDGALHTHPVRETIYTANPLVVAAGEPVPRLEMSADYDLGLGVLHGATDFNGNETRFDFDSFGRLGAITKPGDSVEFPTTLFRYRLADGLTNKQTINWVETRQREAADRDGTFDSRSYFDGLGRKRMTRTESERPGEVVVNDAVAFSQRRNAWKALLPYFEPGTLEFQPVALTNDFTETRYDALGRPTQVFQPSTSLDGRRGFTRTSYAPLARLLEDEEQTRPDSPHSGAAMRYTEDGLRGKEGNGRLRRVEEVVKLDDQGRPATDPRVWVTTYRYDLLDNFTGYTDSQGNEKEFRYDALSRKAFMNDPDRGVMFWDYDDASNLIHSRDAKAQDIRYTYDGANRLLTEDYLDEARPNITADYAFNPAQALSATNRPDVAYFYDVPVTNLDLGNTTTATAQNTQGFLARVWDLTGEEHTSYDARGRVAWIVKRIRHPQFSTLNTRPSTDLVSYRTGFAYDSFDRLTQLTYPDDDFVFHQYNPRNLLERIHGDQVVAALDSSNVVAGIVYRASSQLARISYGNGVETTYDYDPRLRLTSLATLSRKSGEGPGVRELIHFAYFFDEASNIERIEDRRPLSAIPAGDPRRNTQHYRYDDLYRITEARYGLGSPDDLTRDDGRIHYRYDRIGNMLEQTSSIEHDEKGLPVANLGNMSYGGPSGPVNRIGRQPGDAPGPHALTSVSQLSTLNSQPRNYPYDSNGNMTVIDGLTNTWDFKDRLIAVENGEMRADYTYDYTDRRVTKRVSWKTVSTNNTSGANPGFVLYPDRYFEVREHGAPIKYVWHGDTRVARVTAQVGANERVQRFTLQPGWNIVALAVTLSDAASQLRTAPVHQVLRQGPGPGQYSLIQPGETLPVGTILRVQASAAGTLAVRGTWTAPASTTYPAGRHWIANSRFEPLEVAARLPADAPLWFFDAARQDWRHRFPDLLASAGDHPSRLAPGEATFAATTAPFTLSAPDPTLEIRYYHQDHLGSTSVMTDANGQLVSESAYYPFGYPRQETQVRGVKRDYQFAQKERDGESGLDHFETRFLLGNAARFLSIDPLAGMLPPSWLKDPQAGNLYSYCRNRPVVAIDPDGKNPTFLLAAAIVAGYIAYQEGTESIQKYTDHQQAFTKIVADQRQLSDMDRSGHEVAGDKLQQQLQSMNKDLRSDYYKEAVKVLINGLAGGLRVEEYAQLGGKMGEMLGEQPGKDLSALSWFQHGMKNDNTPPGLQPAFSGLYDAKSKSFYYQDPNSRGVFRQTGTSTVELGGAQPTVQNANPALP